MLFHRRLNGSEGVWRRRRRTIAAASGSSFEEIVASPVPTAGGFPVGLLPGVGSWTPVTVPLPREGGVLLYTDGMTDCQIGVGDERLGVEGLTSLVGKAWQPDSELLLEDLVRMVTTQDAGRNLDDLAVLYVTWGASADDR